MLMALLDILDTAPSSRECDLDLEWELELELDLDLDRDFLLLSEEGSEEELGSSPVKTGLKRQKYFL